MSQRVFIVDDEEIARQKIRDFLVLEEDVEIAGEAADGPEAVRGIQAAKPDLVFLDIRMPGMDGFEVLEALDLDPLPAVIFATAYDQYAVQAFERHALDYLLKPFDQDRLHEALLHARQNLRSAVPPADLKEQIADVLRSLPKAAGYRSRFAVPAKGRLYFVQGEDVERIEAAGNYVILHTPPQEHLLRTSLAEVEKSLDPKMFVRIHRSTIVRADRIVEIRPLLRGGAAVVLKSGVKVFASRYYKDTVRQILKGRT
jgi:two-component system LytT family response regulator